MQFFRSLTTLCLTLFMFVGPASAEKTFRLAVPSEPTTKGNPYFTITTNPNFVFAVTYDALTQIGNDGQLIPWLAESWEPDSETSWVFRLRPGVRFSNGEPFNADTVKTIFDLLRTDAANGFFWQREAALFPKVDVIDDLTVRIHTAEPNALAPHYLSNLYMAAPQHLRDVSFEGLAAAPVGTGAFKLERWGTGRIQYTSHENAWNAAQVDRMEVLIVSDSSARLQALMTNRVDVVTGISTDQLDAIAMAGHRTEQRNPTRIMGLGLLATDPSSPFSDTRVRQAVNYAVNRQLITDVLLAGSVTPASQPAVPMAFGYDPDLAPFPYDPEKAKALLAEAGYEDGFSFVLESPSGTMPNDLAVLQQIATDLRAVNVEMEARLVTFPQLVRATLQGEWAGQALVIDYTNRYGDALAPFTRGSNHNCNGIKPWYCDPDITALANRAYATFDLDERRALTQQIIKHHRDDAHSLLMFPIVGMDGVHKRISGWQTHNDQPLYHLVEIVD